MEVRGGATVPRRAPIRFGPWDHPTATARWKSAGRAPGTAAVIVSVVGLIALPLAVARLTGRLRRIPGPDVAFAAVCVSIVASRVFSPQYMIWLLGIGAVCLVWRRTARVPVVLMLAAAAAAQILYPYGWPIRPLISGGVAATLQVARICDGRRRDRTGVLGSPSGAGYPVCDVGSTPSSKSVNRADMAFPSPRMTRSHPP